MKLTWQKEVIVWALLGSIVSVLGTLALRAHDERVRAEVIVSQAQTQTKALQGQITQQAQATKNRVTAIQHKAAAVKTPAQAIAAIPDVSNVPLNVRPLPALPDAVAVDAVPLYQELATCRITEAKLDGCTKTGELQQQVTAEKDKEIAALQKLRGGFWTKVKACAVRGAVGAGSGAAFGGKNGASFGAALGFGSCLVVKP